MNSVNTAESDLDGTTEVGAYSNSTSYYGTFDQTGNAWEWTENRSNSHAFRCMRGGAYGSSIVFLTTCQHPSVPGDGFRVATLPTLLGDCNGDRVLSPDDLSCVSSVEARNAVLNALNTLPGDLDGNGKVEFADYLVLSSNFGTDLSGYADGNIDLNNGVEFADFLVLSAHFGETASLAAVPEPSHLSWWTGLSLLGFLASRRAGAA